MKKNVKYAIIAGGTIIVVLFILKASGIIGTEGGIKISTERAKLRTITELITASGKIQPETEVNISSDVSGEIVELFVKEGQEVKKGDLLIKIKPDLYLSSVERAEAGLNGARAQLAQAKARLAQSEAMFQQSRLSYKRNKELFDRKTISRAEFEQAEANFLSAKAELEAAKQTVNAAGYTVKSSQATLKEARENLKKTGIYAPITGTISKLNVEKGERVVGTMQMAGTELLRIAEMDKMEVLTEVNENDIVKVNLNDTAIIEVDAYLGNKFKGIVSEIANSSKNTGNRQVSSNEITNFEVKILLLPKSYEELQKEYNTSMLFRPGMTATADIRTNTIKHIVTVPIKAVTTREDTAKTDNSSLNDDDPLVVVFKYMPDATAKLAIVETGIQDDEYIQILSGLSEEDEIITEPYNIISKRLEDGKKVEKVKKEELYVKEE
ncbi:MAG: efflux RND transporter periplasmic adaptor subunit [Bacteroidota bacterium]|nr:efflux RND transporter periplasmic adaptor subunit [Bacteroidota bacterium]